ncbi:MAG: LTA synthase family protein [Lachnospiraceae bacterium]|nr:LTA synthase family protein [Lachnospiraceae bacterium]
MNIYLGESHAGKNNIAQLFYSEDAKKFTSAQSVTQSFADDVISIPIQEVELKDTYLRLDPFNQKGNFSIVKMEVLYGEDVVLSLQGKELKKQIQKMKKISKRWEEGVLYCEAKNSNPRIIMKQSFSRLVYQKYLVRDVAPYIGIILLCIVLGIVEVRCLKGATMKKGAFVAMSTIVSAVLVLGIVILYAFQYFESHLGQVPFSHLMYHLHTPLGGTDVSSYTDVIIIGVVLTLLCVALYLVVGVILKKREMQFGYLLWGSLLGLSLILIGGIRAVLHFDIIEYYEYTKASTTLYEDYYGDGRKVELTFPEEKRNLIYIFLESMEITFADVESGGAMAENYMPELTRLALDNNCFTDGNVLNGAYHVNGATYTMGAMAAHTCGVPINTELIGTDTVNSTFESENNYLPGVWSIGDVLAEQGYNQELLIGSVGDFAGRSSYFRGHGGYMVEDYKEAITKERIPADYKVWWGYEDKKLFDFAKEDITKLAAKGQPFNFTMLTADTHFTDGYLCECCGGEYDEQYSNVIACSSKQVMEFIGWIQEQDFYENTTIVLAGDHLTMDSAYINNQGAAAFDRRMYFNVINAAEGKVNHNGKRTYTSLDLYPTTLSSLGVSIEGDRLGLGVDLYSDTPTLAEQYGLEYLNMELQKNSEYYTKELLYK